MSDNGMNRRDFLKSGGSTAVVAAVATSGAAALAPTQVQASLALDFLTLHEGQTLLRMCRQIYPHDSLADLYYASLVEELDQEAAEQTDTAQLIKNGVVKLDTAKGIKWLDLSDGNQLSVLKGMQDDPFFLKVKGKTLTSLYNNPLVWRHFGYEGEAYSKGGYTERGFNDLAWLPEPSEEASPKGWWEEQSHG